MVTKNDIGKAVEWWDLHLRRSRHGMLKGLSVDGSKAFVDVVIRHTEMKPSGIHKLETLPADQPRVIQPNVQFSDSV